MEIRELYKYKDGDSVIFSPIKPEGVEYKINYRLIADEGFAVTSDNENFYQVIDVDSEEGWFEVKYDFDKELDIFHHSPRE